MMTVCTTDSHTDYKRIMDRLTAILTVYADGRKAPIVIIVKSKRPKSFTKRFNPVQNLGAFYFAERNEWNTKALWELQKSELARLLAPYQENFGRDCRHFAGSSVEPEAKPQVGTLFETYRLMEEARATDAKIGEEHLYGLEVTAAADPVVYDE